MDWNEPIVRATAFAATVGVLLLAEWVQPLRSPSRRGRWAVNTGLFVADTLLVRLIPASSLVALALVLENHAIGLFHHVDAPAPVEGALAVIALDATMYWQHRLFHGIPALWRLHAVHHSDVEFDTTTGVRFHPGEVLVSLLLKAAAVVALGASATSVLVFEVLLSSTSLFTHANVRFGGIVDRLLRNLIVTPDMHRVHHSVFRDEHNHNFGFLIVWWDRWFGSYRSSPREDMRSMRIGLDAHRSEREQRFAPLLAQPFLPR